MTFEQFYKSLAKRWYIVLMCFLCVGAGAYVGSSVLLHPVYQSTTVVQVVVRTGGNPFSQDNLLAGTSLAETEADLVTTYPVLNSVAAKNPGISVDDLSGEVQATARSNKQLFDITVKNQDPNLAAKLANDTAQSLISTQPQLAPSSATDGTSLVVVEQARVSDTPTSPNKTINAAGGLAFGLILGLLLAVIIELSDKRIHSKKDITSLLDSPVLGTVWLTDSKENVINLNSYNANADSYSILQTNIGFTAIDRPLHSLVVTSIAPGDGKTVIAANLAISMARSGKKTLLVDANLRHPMLNELFNIPPHTQGLTNAIVAFRIPATANPQQGIMPFTRSVNIPNLSVMPSGPLPPVPSEMLAANAMQGFLTGLSNSGFEVVVFDSPSLLGLSDAAVLAAKVDGTIVVIDITEAKKKDLKQANEQLEQAGAQVLGYVINKESQHGKDIPYKHVSYPRDAAIANQNIEYSSPPVAPPMPQAAAPVQVPPVARSGQKPPQFSAHGIPPQKPPQFSAPGVSPQKDR